MWSVGTSLASGSKELAADVVCRDKFGEWVKGIGGGCGLSGQVWRVGQRNWRRMWSVGAKRASGSKELTADVVCRVKYGKWVKRIVGGVWSVGAKRASGSRELLMACGLSGQVWRVGQENCRRRVVCRGENVEWVKGIVARVWSVGASLASGSKELSAGMVCRGEKGEWVKEIVGGVWSVGAKRASGSRGLSLECGLSGRKGRVGQEACRWRVVCRRENGE